MGTIDTTIAIPPETLVSAFPFFTEVHCGIIEPEFDPICLNEGETLFSVGEPATRFYIIVDGLLAVRKPDSFGVKGQVVVLLSPHAPVGERALVQYYTHTSTLIAAQDSVLLCLEVKTFNGIKTQYPELAVLLLEFLLSKSALRLEHCSSRLSKIL